MIAAPVLEVAVVCLGIFLLMLDAFVDDLDRRWIGRIAMIGLGVIFVASFFVAPAAEMLQIQGFYLSDPLAMFFKRFVLLATVLTTVLSMEYLPIYQRFIPAEHPQAGVGELFTLPVFACAGMMWMVSAADFIMIFVALELVTITFYILVASMRRSTGSLEAGVKYLILGALSTGFLVFGITWIFGMLQQTNLKLIADILPFMPENRQTGLLFGLGLVFVALGFKVAAFPFQFWVPDVYQGAPTPVTAFLSVASKASGFVVLLRVIEPFLLVPALEHKIVLVISILAGATLIFGNLAAMPQTNLKRLLAYSSVAHAGYLLIGVASVGAVIAGTAVAYYLAGYLFMTYLAFLVMLIVARSTGGDEIADFNGLGRRAPGLAFAMVLAMVSLAGLPFTTGFLGKFFIFEAAMAQEQYALVALGAITVACGFYYYLKVVRAMYWQPAPEGAGVIEVSPLAQGIMIFLGAGILIFGIFPQPILAMLK